MESTNFKYPDKQAYQFVVQRLEEKGVSIDDIAEISYNMQHKFLPLVEYPEYVKSTITVLHKRELLNNAMVGLELDRLATEQKLVEPLQSIISNDAGVFGTDEALAVSISSLYGMIGVTDFGFSDHEKRGVLKKLDTEKDKGVNTFIDDLVGAIASAVSAKIAHAHS